MKKTSAEQKDDLDKMLDLDLLGLPYIPPGGMTSGGVVGPRNANPVVYLEIAAMGGRKLRSGEITKQSLLGRLYIELRRDLLPVAATNFFELCAGSRGVGRDGVKYHYKGTRIHRVLKNVMLQGGDLLDTEGDTSRSVYDNGRLFRDENMLLRHTGPGVISYCNRGPDTNGSLFQIVFSRNEDLDNRCEVFGCLAGDESYECLRRVSFFGTPHGAPLEELRIVDSGVAFN